MSSAVRAIDDEGRLDRTPGTETFRGVEEEPVADYGTMITNETLSVGSPVSAS